MVRASNNTDGPEFKDQVRGAAVSVLPLHPAVVMEETQSPPPSLPVPDEGPSFKDQARDARPSAVVGPLLQPPSHIALTNTTPEGPDYKDQARCHHPTRSDKISQISEITTSDTENGASPTNAVTAPPELPVWSASTMDAELVSAQLVPESVDPDSNPPVFLKAEVVDVHKERRRMMCNASLIILGILSIVLVPTFILAFHDDNTKSSSESEVMRPTTPPLLLTNSTNAQSTQSPSSPHSMSLSPSAAPTVSARYMLLGDPIATDLRDQQRVMASLSTNGTVVAVANNDTIQVYQQAVSFVSGNITWVPLGTAVPAEAEIATPYDRNFTMFLAPDALVLAVGIPSVQNSAGRVDVYDYHGSSDQWIARGESFTGNSTDQLGYDVALSSDGSILAIASCNYSSGVSYVSVWSWNATSETWLFYGEINGLSGAPSLSIAVSDPRGDYFQGPRIILGDPNDGIVGKAEVHECIDYGGCSLLDVRLKGPDYEDFFGHDVSISRNGEIIAVGSPGIPDCIGREFCANVKVYELGDRGTELYWTLFGQELFGMIGFGEKIKLSQDGLTLAVYFAGGSLSDEIWTQLYQIENGTWNPVGAPITNAEFLDMSYDGTVVATAVNGEVVVQTLLFHDARRDV